MQRYLEAVWLSVKPIYVLFATVISYVLFPTETYKSAAIGLACAVVVDLATKLYAIAKKNGGLIRAIADGHIRSNKLWEGTSRKVFIYLVLMVLSGLSVRVSPVEQIAVFGSTLVYSFCFVREGISSIENLLYADEDNEWLNGLLYILKKKEKEMVKRNKK